MADLIIRHINDEPKGTVITSEVMFDKNISGELPEHIDFIHRTIPTLESWGYEVKILHSDITYMDCFNKVNQGKKHIERKGMRYGFPMAGRCIINDRCKMKPIRDYLSSINGDYIQSVGIAIDEPKRLERMENDKTRESMLAKYKYTEQMAYDLAKKFDMLSPVYSFSKRGGCWFCPNARDCELRNLRDNHNHLWKKLLDLENEPNTIGNIWNTLTKTSIHDKDEQFRLEDAQITIFDFLDD